MWKSSRSGDEVSTPDKETSAPSSKSIPTASAPSSAAEALRSHSVQSHPTTFVGKLLVVKGELSGKEALVVEGEVEGSITLHGQRLTVRPNGRIRDRKSTRLNSSHLGISYAVFCLKKK